MEHFEYSKLLSIRLLCLVICALFIFGCNREDPTPEVRDPIYKDLMAEKKMLEQFREDFIKKIAAAEIELEKSQPRTMERKTAINDLLKEQMNLAKTDQLIEYFDIRTKERYVEARRAYREAFRNKQPWPDKNEFEAYKTNKRLLHASKNWNDRVPRSKTQQPDTKK